MMMSEILQESRTVSQNGSAFNFFSIKTLKPAENPIFKTKQPKRHKEQIASLNQEKIEQNSWKNSGSSATSIERSQNKPEDMRNKSQVDFRISGDFKESQKWFSPRSTCHFAFEKSKSHAALDNEKEQKTAKTTSTKILRSSENIIVLEHNKQTREMGDQTQNRWAEEERQWGARKPVFQHFEKEIKIQNGGTRPQRQRIDVRVQRDPSKKGSTTQTTMDPMGGSFLLVQKKPLVSFVNEDKCSPELIEKMKEFSRKMHSFLARNGRPKRN